MSDLKQDGPEMNTPQSGNSEALYSPQRLFRKAGTMRRIENPLHTVNSNSVTSVDLGSALGDPDAGAADSAPMPTPHVRDPIAASKAPLVTNTESALPPNQFSALQAPSLLSFEKYNAISKRYVLQSVSKELLNACSVDENGKKSEFYRLGACGQLSADFRPGAQFESKSTSNHGLTMPAIPDHFDSFMSMKREFANHFAASIGRRTDDNGISQFHFLNMCHCGSAWICPVCQPKVTEYRAKEVAYGMHQFQSEGGYLVFVTFTVPHKRSHSLQQVIQALTKSIKSLKEGPPFQRFKAKNDYIGSIRALEWTYTDRNGHHPHVHELWFFESKPDLKKIKKWVYDRYAKFVVKHEGFDKPSERRGVDMRLCLTNSQLENVFDGADLNDVMSLSGYITKGAEIDKTAVEYVNNRDWGAPEELTKANLKSTRTYTDGTKVTGFNPISLLLEYMQVQYLVDTAQFSSGKPREALLWEMSRLKKLYLEYATFTKGRAQLYWSKGLKKRFGIYEMDDDLVLEGFDSELVEFMSLTLDDIQKIVKFRLRPRILQIASNPEFVTDEQRKQAIKDFLTSVSTRVDRFG